MWRVVYDCDIVPAYPSVRVGRGGYRTPATPAVRAELQLGRDFKSKLGAYDFRRKLQQDNWIWRRQDLRVVEDTAEGVGEDGR